MSSICIRDQSNIIAFLACTTLGQDGVGFDILLWIHSVFNIKRRQAKIALRADSDDQLLQLEAIAKSLNLCARSIQDQYAFFSRILHALILYFWNQQRTNAGRRRNTDSLRYRTGACRINQRSDWESASSLKHSCLVCIFDMTLSKLAEMCS